MITYQNISKGNELIAMFNLTGATLLVDNSNYPIQLCINDNNKKYFNPDYWYLDNNGLYKIKKPVAVIFNFIGNVSGWFFGTTISKTKDGNIFDYIYYNIGGINQNENNYYHKRIFLMNDEYLCIRTDTDQTIQKRYILDYYDGFFIYLTGL